MPTYGYRCGACGHEFEIVQRISDEPLITCPKCQGKLSKMPYAAGVIFRGSGYYTTDYKGSNTAPGSSSNGAASGSEGKAEGKSEGKAEGKAEGKSEGKSEPKPDTKSEGKSDSKTEKAS
jgi:putative FmdB family regulatory protein